MRKALSIVLAAVFAAAGIFLAVQLVSAHSRPVRFEPAPGSILTSAPSQVTGWFTSDIRRTDQSFIQVTDGSGSRVDTGDVQLTPDRRQMSIALKSGLGNGRYIVYWSTFDDMDGEVFSGCYTFFVGQQAADDAVGKGQALDGGGDCPANASSASMDMANVPSVALDLPEVVSGDSATLNIIPTNFTVRAPDGKTRDPNFGHYHIYLDKWPIELLTGESGHEHSTDMATNADSHDAMESKPSGGMAENPVMVAKNNYTFTDLEPGVHTVTVALTYDDHSLIDPPVLASRSFQVEADSSGGIPTWALIAGVVIGVSAGAAGMRLMAVKA